MTPAELWAWLPIGYLLTVAFETPVLMAGLAPRHSMQRRLFAGLWLTACTYPIVILVMPLLVEPRWLYLTVAEVFAPVAECALFWAAFGERETVWRDFATITLANVTSFLIGEILF